MATIKSFTDLQQSKKLAEILPLETADMHYWHKGQILGVGHSKELQEGFESKKIDYTPCWSLAALYGILPNNKKETTTLSRGGWKIAPPEYIDNWWCEYEDERHTEDFTVSADNPIDACYELILQLHKLKKL